MLKGSNFFVLGPVTEDETATYWNNESGWIEDITQATAFDRRVLTIPLPPGGTGIVEYLDNSPVWFVWQLLLPPREESLSLSQ